MIAFTGTRRLHPGAMPLIEAVLRTLPEGCWQVVGGADGVDTAVARIGKALGHRNLLVAPAAYWNTDNLAWADSVEQAPAGRNAAHSYRLRDALMVERGDELYAFPRTATEEVRSGTWMTVRLARQADMRVHIFPLSGRAA